VVVGSTEQPVLAGGADPEFVDPRLNETVLRQLAERTGGRYLTGADATEIGDALRAGRAERHPPQVRDLWHNAWSFGMIVALLAAEWALRRKWGLR